LDGFSAYTIERKFKRPGISCQKIKAETTEKEEISFIIIQRRIIIW
jgi:hypothetical protein